MGCKCLHRAYFTYIPFRDISHHQFFPNTLFISYFYQYCGAGIGYCGGDCCQSGPCTNGPSGPNPPSPTPPPPPPPPPSGGGNYNYCGLTWADANSQCGVSCYGGTNGECPTGGCYGDATNCALVTGPNPATPPPGPTPPPSKYPTRSPNNDPPPDLDTGDSRLIAYV